MKTCEDFELLINLCLDDMLSGEERQMLEQHLCECSACREKYKQLSTVKTALSQMEEPAPSELHDRILDYVKENTRENTPVVKAFPGRRRYRAIAGIAACAVIAVLAGRFVPAMDFAAAENNAAFDAAMPETAMPAPSLGDSALTDAPQLDSKPSQNVILPGNTQFPEKEYISPAAPDGFDNTGQMAEDLPPLRDESAGGDHNYRETSIRKWLKVTGRRDRLPQWVDWSSVYETEIEGETCVYVEIADWAETYWVDNLNASGFVVEEMEGRDLTMDGDRLLLFFFLE